MCSGVGRGRGRRRARRGGHVRRTERWNVEEADDDYDDVGDGADGWTRDQNNFIMKISRRLLSRNRREIPSTKTGNFISPGKMRKNSFHMRAPRGYFERAPRAFTIRISSVIIMKDTRRGRVLTNVIKSDSEN